MSRDLPRSGSKSDNTVVLTVRITGSRLLRNRSRDKPRSYSGYPLAE
ncbi:hypothetical protein [Pseudomonas graminis]|nr:hypothetical protein [Pseudomonas graminis]